MSGFDLQTSTMNTHMLCHILKTVIDSGQHLREVFTAHEASGPGGIESSRHWLKIIVIFQIVFKITGKTINPFLIFEKAFTLFLEGRCLRLDILE